MGSPLGPTLVMTEWKTPGIDLPWCPSFLDPASLLHSLQGGLQCFLICLSTDGKVLYVSSSVTSLLGHSQESLLGQSLGQFLHPADLTIFKNKMLPPHQALSLGGSGQFSHSHVSVYVRFLDVTSSAGYRADSFATVHISGQSHLHQLAASPVVRQGIGRMLTFVCRVLRPQQLWRQVEAESTVTECVLHHALNGTILFTDSRWSRVMGYMPQELVGQSMYNFIHAKDRQVASLAHHKVLTQPREVSTVYRVVTQSRQTELVHTCSRVAYRGAGGRPSFILTLCTILGKVEGRGLLERSHREVHLVQSDPSQRRLLLDFPKLLQRLPAGQLCSPCPETESNSAFSTAAFPPRPLCDANSSEGDLLSVSYPGFLQPFSSAIQTHRHSPTLANFSTSAVQRSRKCANSMAYQTAVEQDVPGQTDVGFHDSKDIRGRARGRARGGRVVKPGQGRSDKEFDRPVDTFDSLPQKRPRGRPRGTRGKAPVSRTASVPQDGCFGSGGGDVGESGGCPAPQNRYWEVVESGGPSSSNSFAPGLCPSPMLTSSLTSTLHTRGTSLNTVATYVPFVRSDKAALAPSDTVQQQTERRATHPQWGRDCAFDVGTAVGAAFHGDSTKKRRTSGEDDITEITRSSAFTGGFSTQTPNSQTFVHQASVGRQGQSQIEGCVTSRMLPMSNDGYTDSSFDSLVPSATVNYLESLDLGDDFWSELFHGLPSTGHLPPDTAPAHSQPLIPAADNDKPVLSCPAADLNLTAINADGLASLFVSAGSMSDLSSVLASVYPPAGHHQAPVDAALSGQPDTFLKPKPVMSIRRDQCILENILTGCGVKSKPGAIAGITSDQHPYTTVSHRSPVFSDFTLDDVSVLSAGCSANHIHAQRHKHLQMCTGQKGKQASGRSRLDGIVDSGSIENNDVLTQRLERLETIPAEGDIRRQLEAAVLTEQRHRGVVDVKERDQQTGNTPVKQWHLPAGDLKRWWAIGGAGVRELQPTEGAVRSRQPGAPAARTASEVGDSPAVNQNAAAVWRRQRLGLSGQLQCAVPSPECRQLSNELPDSQDFGRRQHTAVLPSPLSSVSRASHISTLTLSAETPPPSHAIADQATTSSVGCRNSRQHAALLQLLQQRLLSMKSQSDQQDDKRSPLSHLQFQPSTQLQTSSQLPPAYRRLAIVPPLPRPTPSGCLPPPSACCATHTATSCSLLFPDGVSCMTTMTGEDDAARRSTLFPPCSSQADLPHSPCRSLGTSTSDMDARHDYRVLNTRSASFQPHEALLPKLFSPTSPFLDKSTSDVAISRSASSSSSQIIGSVAGSLLQDLLDFNSPL